MPQEGPINSSDYFLVVAADLRNVRVRVLMEMRDVETPANTVRWVSAPEPVIARDRAGTLRRWEPWPWRPAGISSSLGEISGTTSITIANEGNVLSPFIDDDSIGLREIDLLMAWLDPETWHMRAVTTIPLLSCSVDSAAVASGVVTLRLGARNDPTFVPFPRRRIHPTCQWEYGGPGCGPKGAMAFCNHTPSVDGGCADPGSIIGGATGGKLFTGVFSGMLVSAQNL